MSSIDRVVLTELMSEELSRLGRDELLDVAREVQQGLSFCLSRALPCAELIELLHDLAKSLPRIRLSKVYSGAVPAEADERSFVDLEFLEGVARGLYIYYMLLLGLADHELRVPVRFDEEIVLGGRRYRAFSTRLVRVTEAVALLLAGAKMRIVMPGDIAKRVNALLRGG